MWAYDEQLQISFLCTRADNTYIVNMQCWPSASQRIRIDQQFSKSYCVFRSDCGWWWKKELLEENEKLQKEIAEMKSARQGIYSWCWYISSISVADELRGRFSWKLATTCWLLQLRFPANFMRIWCTVTEWHRLLWGQFFLWRDCHRIWHVCFEEGFCQFASESI